MLIRSYAPYLSAVNFRVKSINSVLLVKGFYIKIADKIIASAQDIQ